MTNFTTKETKIVGITIFIAGILAFITYYAYKGEVSVDVVVYCYIGSITFILGAFGFALDPRIATVVKNIILLVEDIVRGKVTIDTAMERIKILIKTLVEIYNDLWLSQGKIKTPATTAEQPNPA
jgi:hypothetical protein